MAELIIIKWIYASDKNLALNLEKNRLHKRYKK